MSEGLAAAGEDRPRWFARKCSGGCGRELAARTDDPAIKVMCTACHPGDLPFSPDDGSAVP
jgi:hypothetical protein